MDVLRTLAVTAGALRAPRLGLLEPSRLAMRVWPDDLDLNLHLNNGRYLALMDQGRLDLFVRLGLGHAMVRARWQALMGGALLRYRRPLAPFARFHLVTRVVCWDEKWLYLEQRFEGPEGVAALALLRVLLRGKAGNVAPEQVLASLGLSLHSPPMPEAIREWIAADRLAAEG